MEALYINGLTLGEVGEKPAVIQAEQKKNSQAQRVPEDLLDPDAWYRRTLSTMASCRSGISAGGSGGRYRRQLGGSICSGLSADAVIRIYTRCGIGGWT